MIKIRYKRHSTWALLLSALLGSCGTTPAAHVASGPMPKPPFNNVAAPAGDCWAKLYEYPNLGGRALTIAGPARVDDLPPHWGFPWDPRYESLAVGPNAVLRLFDDPEFKEREATFRAGTTVTDLDREMGLFRRVRSATVECVGTKSAQRR